MKRNRVFVLLMFVSIILCACGQTSQTEEESFVIEPTPIPTEEVLVLPNGKIVDKEVEMLEIASVENLEETAAVLTKLPKLKSLQFTETVSVQDCAEFLRKLPDIEIYGDIAGAGIKFGLNAKELDLVGKTPEEIKELLPVLPYMEQLERVELGDAVSSPALSLSDLEPLQQACPWAKFSYGFELYGKKVNSCDTELDLRYIRVRDEGAAVFAAMKYMPQLKLLDMDSCKVKDENMAKIRDAYPNVKVVWRIWFGNSYSVRTDVEMILASNPEKGGCLIDGSTDALKYCTEVRYLDLGHNPDLHTIEFVQYMPKLEVAILAMDNWSDCSPLANCTELEYLEIQTTQVRDISALAGLTNLKHLNICYLYDLTDISPLYGLTKLERLWIGCITPISDEQIFKMQEMVPDCVINTRTYDPTEGGWRIDEDAKNVPRYALLREQFGDYRREAFSFFWNDPLYREVY